MHSLSPCQCCRHRDGWKCAAFPDGIPGPVMRGEQLHFDPLEGDHGIRYQVGDSEEDAELARALVPFVGSDVLRASPP